MTPLIRHLNKIFSDLAVLEPEQSLLDGDFIEDIKKLGPDFYKKIIPLHLLLDIEYRLLNQQLRTNLQSPQVNPQKIKDQLIAAYLLAELLKHIYQDYLIVPREVARLRQQQKLYRQVLTQLGKNLPEDSLDQTEVGCSFTQKVRSTTRSSNFPRLLFIRFKRTLDLLAIMENSLENYRCFVNKYIDPFLAYLAWIFYLPRLFVNLFLIIKHTVPGVWWMDQKEYSLGWSIRFKAQMQRRWFELGNDFIWVAAGLLNCFLLIGALAPVGMYLSLSCFACDIILASLSAAIELNRFYDLKKNYEAMKYSEDKISVAEQIQTIDHQINFEMLRQGIPLMTACANFLAMWCATPLFAINPFIPLVGAICLVMICLINYSLTQIANHHRPKDIIEPSHVAQFGLFAKKPKVPMIDFECYDATLTPILEGKI